MLQGFLPFQLTPNIRIHLMREDIKDPRKLEAKADRIWQSASDQSVVNNLFPVLLPLLLLVLLHALPVLLLHPPLRTPTIVGTIATMGIRLSIAVPPAPGFLETS